MLTNNSYSVHQATVVKHCDGDTIKVQIDGLKQIFTVRLLNAQFLNNREDFIHIFSRKNFYSVQIHLEFNIIGPPIAF